MQWSDLGLIKSEPGNMPSSDHPHRPSSGCRCHCDEGASAVLASFQPLIIHDSFSWSIWFIVVSHWHFSGTFLKQKQRSIKSSMLPRLHARVNGDHLGHKMYNLQKLKHLMLSFGRRWHIFNLYPSSLFLLTSISGCFSKSSTTFSFLQKMAWQILNCKIWFWH